MGDGRPGSDPRMRAAVSWMKHAAENDVRDVLRPSKVLLGAVWQARPWQGRCHLATILVNPAGADVARMKRFARSAGRRRDRHRENTFPNNDLKTWHGTGCRGDTPTECARAL